MLTDPLSPFPLCIKIQLIEFILAWVFSIRALIAAATYFLNPSKTHISEFLSLSSAKSHSISCHNKNISSFIDAYWHPVKLLTRLSVEETDCPSSGIPFVCTFSLLEPDRRVSAVSNAGRALTGSVTCFSSATKGEKGKRIKIRHEEFSTPWLQEALPPSGTEVALVT